MFQNQMVGLKPGWRGRFVLQVSRYLPDWNTSGMVSKAQVESFAKLYCKYALKWLQKRGYQAEIQYVDRYADAGFDWQNQQRIMRNAIMADMLAPENMGQPVSNWKGINREPYIGNVMTKSNARNYSK